MKRNKQNNGPSNGRGRGVRSLTLGVLGAAAVTAGLFLLRSQRETPQEVADGTAADLKGGAGDVLSPRPAPSRIGSEVSLERLRELGI